MLLSDEKIRSILCPYKYTCTDCPIEQYPRCEMVAKAQLIAVWDRLMEPCDKHPQGSFTTEFAPAINSSIELEHTYYFKHRYLCPDCMTEFEAEVQQYKSEVK